MSKAGELVGPMPGKTGKTSRWEALGNLLRRMAFWRESNASLDFAEGDFSPSGRKFRVTFVRFDGKRLAVDLSVEQLDEFSDLFAKAAIGLAHHPKAVIGLAHHLDIKRDVEEEMEKKT